MIPRSQEFDILPGSRHDQIELQNIVSINCLFSSSTWKCENPQHQANSDRFFQNATASNSTCIICSYLRYGWKEWKKPKQNKTKTCCFDQRIWVSLQKSHKKPQKKPKHEMWQTIIANKTNTNRKAYTFKLKQQQNKNKTKLGDANQPSASERDHKQRKHSKFRAND